MARYYETAREALERHGGMLERLVGDEVVGIFGLPVLHEDDALRAVRAAAELRERFVQLNRELEQDGVSLHIRTGVDSGDIVAGAGGSGQLLPTGDVMNVVTRLEEAADPGEILLGEATLRLVRDAIEVEEVGPLTLQGKKDPIPAYRLLVVLPDAVRRTQGLDTPMVGRKREHALFRATFDRAVGERSCHLVTILGTAGVGKTRLVDEFVQSVAAEGIILRGRCLSYGGIAYDAIAQVITQAADINPADPSRVRERLASLVADDEQAGHIIERVEQVLGLRRGAASPEDTHWAVQRLLEILAHKRPLVVVIDDLQWAEPTLLDLVEDLAESVRDAPLLLICIARFELLDHRRRWVGGKVNAVSIQLAPLDDDEIRQLVKYLLGGVDAVPQVHEYVADRAGGNPLFARGLVAMLREAGLLRLSPGRWQAAANLAGLKTPLDIRALLQARLEQLRPDERDVIERAAVIGRQFTVDAVEELLPEMEELKVRANLRALVRKELIAPSGTAVVVPLGRDATYHFHHSLIRDTTYDSIAKEHRADLHERYANWLERVARDSLAQVDEFIGHHLEQAYRNLADIGRNDDRTQRLARRAGEVLAAVGHRAAARGDIPTAAVSLLGRALALLPSNDEVRRGALLDLADALSAAGQPSKALEVYLQAVAASNATSDLRRATHGKLGLLAVKWFNGLEGMASEGDAEVEGAVQVFERLNDDLGLAKAWRLQAYVHWAMGRLARAQSASEFAIELAGRAGDERLEASSVSTHCFVLFWGPTPVDEVIRYSNQAFKWAKTRGIRSLQADALRVLARAAAMQGRFEHARARLREADQIPIRYGDLRGEASAAANHPSDLLFWVGDYISAGLIEIMAGNPVEAERGLRDGYGKLNEMGGRGLLTGVIILLARALALQGRDEEAEQMTRECESLATESQLDARVKWRTIRAVLLARRGEMAAGERLAREAARLAEGWEQIDSAAEVHEDLAEVLRWARKRDEATRSAAQALHLYERKGNLVGVRRVEKYLSMGA